MKWDQIPGCLLTRPRAFVTAILFAQVLAAAAGIPISGTVRDAVGHQPLAGAVVTVDSTILPVITSIDGRYRILLPRVGTWMLRLSRVGFAERRVTITVDRRAAADTIPLVLDVALDPNPVELAPVAVAVRRAREARAAAEPPSTAELGITDLLESNRNGRYLGVTDIGEAASWAPGVTSRSALNWQPHVRGSDLSQTAVRLDGFPVYNATHFGAVSSAVNPDALGLARLRTGILPASTGDRLSGLVDLWTVDTTSGGVRLDGALGVADVRAAVALAPHAGTWQLLAAARTTYRGMLGDGLGAEHRNGYDDMLGTLHAPLAGGTLELLGFRSNNRLGFPTHPDCDCPHDSPVNGNAVVWSSLTLGAEWVGPADLSWRPTLRAWTASAGTHAQWNNVADALDGRFDDHGLSVGVVQTTPRATWRLGLELRQDLSRYATRTETTPADVPGIESSNFRFEAKRWMTVPYAAVDRVFHRWTLSAGLRGVVGAGSAILAPRFSAQWQATDRFTVGAAAGRTVQTEQSLWNEEALGGALLGVEIPVAGLPGISRASSRDVLISGILTMGTHATLSALGYARHFDGLALIAPTATSWFADTLPMRGTGVARGLSMSLDWHGHVVETRVGFGLERSFRYGIATTYRPSADLGRLLTAQVVVHPTSLFSAWLSTNASGDHFASRVAGPLEWAPFAGLTSSGELGGDAQSAGPAIAYDHLPSSFDITAGMRRDWWVGMAHMRTLLSLTVAATNVLGRRNPVALAGTGMNDDAVALAGRPRGIIGEIAWHF
jgi:hypothetical protein